MSASKAPGNTVSRLRAVDFFLLPPGEGGEGGRGGWARVARAEAQRGTSTLALPPSRGRELSCDRRIGQTAGSPSAEAGVTLN